MAESSAGDAQLGILLPRQTHHSFHVLFPRFLSEYLIPVALYQFNAILQVSSVKIEVNEGLIIGVPFFFYFCEDVSCSVVLAIMIDKLFRGVGVFKIVADKHAFGSEGDPAFVADVGSSKRVIACYHQHTHLCLF
jgi:hypothetical protein